MQVRQHLKEVLKKTGKKQNFLVGSLTEQEVSKVLNNRKPFTVEILQEFLDILDLEFCFKSKE